MVRMDEQDNVGIEPREPQRLRDDLSALYGPKRDVPAEVDAGLLDAAQRHFVRTRRARLVLRAVGVGAAAASIMLVVWFARSGGQVANTPVPSVAAAREDIDGNGRIDIRDALLLAQRMKMDRSTRPDWDINGDGVIDRRDVDTIAMAAVRLDGGTYQ